MIQNLELSKMGNASDDKAGFLLKKVNDFRKENEKPKDHRGWELEQWIDQTDSPSITMSADGGTVIIQWIRREDGDSASKLSWKVSKKGTVLRHHHLPPNE